MRVSPSAYLSLGSVRSDACSFQNSLAAALCALLLTAVMFSLRAPFIDDSYITFRYAQRIADFGSISWNDIGAPVMGTTTVLWTMLLAGLYRLGVDIELGALWASVGIVFLLLQSLLALSIRLLSEAKVTRAPLISFLLVGAAVLNVPVRVSLFSGMETGLYCLLTLRAFIALGSPSPLAGIYAGLAALTRPDGMLLLLVGLLFANGKRVLFVAAFAATTFAWFGHSLYYFGELLPGSVEAKQLLYPSSALKNFLMLFEAHSQNALQAALFCLGGAGLLAAVRVPVLRPLLVWLPLYAGGITFSGVKPIFFWYFTPTWLFGMYAGGVSGVCWLVRNQRISQQALLYSLISLVSVVAVDSVRQDVAQEGPFLRERAYRGIVARIRSQVNEGDTLLVGETGILGFGFPKNDVIDSAGITSLEVRTILKKVRERAGEENHMRELAVIPGWSKQLLDYFNPTWIIAARARFDLEALEGEEWFNARYERVSLELEGHLQGIGVYRLR